MNCKILTKIDQSYGTSCMIQLVRQKLDKHLNMAMCEVICLGTEEESYFYGIEISIQTASDS